MFRGMWSTAKALRVLKEEFDYEPNRFQMSILKGILREARESKVNEYDAAIFFMMVQMNALTPSGSDPRVGRIC